MFRVIGGTTADPLTCVAQANLAQGFIPLLDSGRTIDALTPGFNEDEQEANQGLREVTKYVVVQ